MAGTHGIIHYSTTDEKKYFLNVLCGGHLVENYLESKGISYEWKSIRRIVGRIKDKSAQCGRRLSEKEISEIVQRTGS